ncbi:MAG: hypothetical protein SFZ03_04370 [Candidatus Melainabacteria bacterium]|nr:hypothetical protein [Candidatus Melainabacteria bacterium]
MAFTGLIDTMKLQFRSQIWGGLYGSLLGPQVGQLALMQDMEDNVVGNLTSAQMTELSQLSMLQMFQSGGFMGGGFGGPPPQYGPPQYGPPTYYGP